MESIGINSFLLVAGLLFATGFFGVLLRRNALVVLMSLELMLNAVNLVLVAFARYYEQVGTRMMDGPVFVIFIIAVAAAEVAVGLAIIVNIYRQRRTVMLDQVDALKD